MHRAGFHLDDSRNTYTGAQKVICVGELMDQLPDPLAHLINHEITPALHRSGGIECLQQLAGLFNGGNPEVGAAQVHTDGK